MKKKSSIRKTNLKKYTIAGVCIVAAAIGMSSGYMTRQAKAQRLYEEEVAKAQENSEEDAKTSEAIREEQAAQLAEENEMESNQTENEALETASASLVKNTSGETENEVELQSEQATQPIEEETTGEIMEEIVETDASAVPEYAGEATLSWPVEGNVILDYNMDSMVYFATLDQYKYNPAVLIQAAVNEKVRAAQAGTVIDISTNEETGTTLTMDIGGGYQLIYGQLKEVEYNLGDSVSKDAVIGYVSEPTKYYISEGSHLYFAMTKDGASTDPLNYLSQE